MFDNFNFNLISEFKGYISSYDKTNISENYLVRGSQNMYKKLSGTIANRPGLKRRGAADSTVAGVKSADVWRTSMGRVYPVRVANNKLQFESSLADGSNYIWYDLLETSTLINPAVSLTRFVWKPWYEYQESRDRLVMVRGDNKMLHWSGGFTKVSGGTLAGGSGAILSNAIGAAGSGYSAGDLIFIGLSTDTGSGGVVSVTSVDGSGAVTSIVGGLIAAGANYVAGTTYSSTTNGLGGGFTLVVNTTTTTSTLTKLDSTTTWFQDGFAKRYPTEKKLIIGGFEYSYSGGEDSTTIYGVTPIGSAPAVTTIASGSLAVQSVIVSSTDILSTSIAPIAFDQNDFIEVINGQMFVGSYTSPVIKISARTTSRWLGFLDYINVGSLVSGDPDFAILDSPAKGMIGKDGKLFVGSGSNNWHIINPNQPLPTSQAVPGGTAFIYTAVEKVPGSGLSAPFAHEFIENVGGDIVFLAQDNQVRTFSTSVKNIFTKKFPSFSQEIQDELHDDDFTGGHLKAIGEFIYVTAPLSGRHYMYQIRELIDPNGDVVAERLWHPPQISGISRFVEITGVVYGHSNANPQIYQIWDTNQWYDDSPDGGQLSYTSVMRMAYTHFKNKYGNNDFVSTGKFDKTYFEGYLDYGANIYSNLYLDYQGSTAIVPIIVNTVDVSANFYTGNQPTGIGTETLGTNPLGDGLVTEPNNQSLLAKFRAIRDVVPNDSFEQELEVYSVDAGSRWEILRLGINITKSPGSPVELRKSS